MISFSTCGDGLDITQFNLDYNHDLVDVTHKKYLMFVKFHKLKLVL